jgi:LSD1 subclass zinc finger protein
MESHAMEKERKMNDEMNVPELDKEKLSNELTCTGCGAVLKFKPGTKNLVCTYCGAENMIEESAEIIEELNYEKFITEKLDKEEKIDVVSVRCAACGASVTLEPNITSDQCPYCATNIVVKSGSTSSLLKPKSLLPFTINKSNAAVLFRKWINKLWFAPSDLKKSDVPNEKLNGIYVPYWTYDARTQTGYTGQRGTYYYVTETYTTTENGQSVTKTRQVRHTRWNSASGQVSNDFDDVLVIASHSLPKKYTERLEPWNLSQLVSYNDKYLSGFRSETYQVDVTTGLNEAKEKMIPIIRTTIKRDIGGDEQRITTMNTSYSDITFKHILLPIWISSYRYKDKVYRFLINGQTGEVQGERPYSVIKIILTVLIVIAVIIGAILIFN